MNLEKVLAFLVKCREDGPTDEELQEALAIRSIAQRSVVLYKEFLRAGFTEEQAFQLIAINMGRSEFNMWVGKHEGEL